MHNKCLGIFLVVVTVPLIMASIISLGTGKLTTAKYYKELFKKSDAYNLTIKALPKSDNTNKEDIMAAIYTNMTPAWLEQTITQNFDQFDAYFNGKSMAIDPSIDITAFKSDLTTNLPEGIQKIVPNVISFSTYSTYLNQAQKTITQNMNPSLTANQENLSAIQKQFDSTSNSQQQFFKNMDSAKKGYHLANIFRYVLYALTILMLIVISLAARHWYPAIFRWTGQTLLIGGLLTLGLFFAFKEILLNFNVIAKFNFSIEVKNIVTPLYNNIFTDFTFSIAKISLLVAIIGLIFLITSYILAHFIPAPIVPSTQNEPKPAKA